MTQAMAVYEDTEQGLTVLQFSQTQLDLLKSTIAKGTTDDQFRLFVEVAQRSGLNPFAKQIYAVVRNTKEGDKWVPTMTVQTGVDGYRLIAQRTGEYAGQLGPMWCGPDGLWHDVWLDKAPPAAARVGVLRRGFTEPVWGVATYQSYCQRNRDGEPQGLWRTMPDVMIAKCAEVLALRKAFPQELSGLYADVEMEQADNAVAPPRPPVQQPRRKSERNLAAEAEKLSKQNVRESTGEVDPKWTDDEMNALLAGQGLVINDLQAVTGPFGEDIYGVIDAWLDANPGKGLAALVGMAKEKKAEATQKPLV